MIKNIYRHLIIMLLLVTTNLAFSQKYLLPNETVIFSFETKNGKKVLLAKDKKDHYIVYRYGTKDNIEFEFPEKTKESWAKFKFYFYSRPGGIQNEAMDINQVSFMNYGYRYSIYDSYYSVGDEISVGVTVTDLQNNKTTDIEGRSKSKKGDLNAFRDNGLLKIEDIEEGH